MTAVLQWLFGTARFVPHGVCLLWRPDLVAIHAISDTLIALSYFAIPGAIWWFVKQRPDLAAEHRRIAILFAIFITACGLTHVAGVVTLWQPFYGAQALLKAVTAVVSLATALALPGLAPKLLSIPSAQALRTANDELQAEAAAHQATLRELQTARASLELQVAERVQDIRVLNERFTAGLRNSPVTLTEQDDELRYSWVFNPPLDIDPDDMVGHRGEDYAEPETLTRVMGLRRDVLATGETREAEISVARGGRVFWYLVRVQPTRLRDGAPGVLTSSIDISAQKHQQEHLQLITRELNHRSKNLLTIVQSIARQTASGLDVPPAFLERLGERLGSLAAAHDVLVEGDWRGADLRAVIESQLKHQLQTVGDRIGLDGARVELAPEMAHYVGLAIHELGANAVKYGPLSGDLGRVDIVWSSAPGPDGGVLLQLDWRESGGPPVEAGGLRGFGRTILEVLTPRAMGGTAALAFDAAGVNWSLRAPIPADQSPRGSLA